MANLLFGRQLRLVFEVAGTRTLTLMVLEKEAFCALYPVRRIPCWLFQIEYAVTGG